QLGILTSLKLGTPVLRLRLMPTLSFQERVLEYRSLDSSNFKNGISEERINSTCLNIPLTFIFKTKRFNNFTAYALFGGQYCIDLQSQQDASQNYIDPFIKLNRYDIQGQLGAGVEFFAPFFKFAVELKYSHGVQNSFIQDFSPVAKPVDQLYNKGWWISIIFES
ncbi:MAG: PorT family protein, partial [Crocinitomicaceae bacterium]|nr:PorT family protein [Crocinitomicaceae bacterium]